MLQGENKYRVLFSSENAFYYLFFFRGEYGVHVKVSTVIGTICSFFFIHNKNYQCRLSCLVLTCSETGVETAFNGVCTDVVIII